MSNHEHACPSSRPPFAAGIFATAAKNLFRLLKETLMGKTSLALSRVRWNRAGIKPDTCVPDATKYLAPDLFHIGRFDAFEGATANDEIWIGPGPSRGTRDPDKKNVISFRGALQHHADNRVLVIESTIEARLAKILEARNDVVEIRDQEPVAEWVDEDGVLHEHTFDFWVRLASGRTIAIAVKPAERVEPSGVVDILRRIAEQGGRHLADDFAVVTELYASHDAAHNAGWILYARRARNEAAYAEAFEIVSRVHGHLRFHDLVSGSGHPAARRVAIWNLIDEGHLAAVEPGRITDLSWLRPAGQK